MAAKVTSEAQLAGLNLRVLRVLRAGPVEGMRLRDVAAALDSAHYQQPTGMALTRLVNWRLVRRVGRGVYAAVG